MEDYESFYEASIAPALRRLEVRRRRTIWNIAALGAIILTSGLGFIFHQVLAATTGAGEDQVIIAAVLIGFAAGGLIFHLQSRMRHEIKTALVVPTCRFLGLDYTLAAKGFPLARFDAARILPHYDRAKLQDHIRGQHQGIDFELCEAALEERVRRKNGKGRTTTHHRSTFRGLLLIYRFPKPFSARTVVLPDRSWLGNRITGFRHGERVKLEDPRFEEIYAAYSDDQVEARYLLTPGFMERLTVLADHLGARSALSFAFDDQDVLIAFNSRTSHFEGGNLFKPLDDPERAEALLQELRLIHDLVERLNLTNRTGV